MIHKNKIKATDSNVSTNPNNTDPSLVTRKKEENQEIITNESDLEIPAKPAKPKLPSFTEFRRMKSEQK